MGTPTQEASRIGLGTFQYAGANGFTNKTLLQVLTAAGFAGADLPGATALDSGSVLSGYLGTDSKILTGFDIYVVAGFFYYEADATAATNADQKVDVGSTLRIRDLTMPGLKNYRFFCDAGTTFDLRINLWG